MAPLATVGILSCGDMGIGVAKILLAHGYRVVTNIEGRSADTQARVQATSIETVLNDVSLVAASDYVFSIVPPRDALTIAKRITSAFASLRTPKALPFYFVDLNAISPNTARTIANLISNTAPAINFVDGGIIGHPPSLKSVPLGSEQAQSTNLSVTRSDSHAWNRPSISVSGPKPLSDSPISGQDLQDLLCIKHISSEIGPASGLKMCFATTTKGFTALCIQAFTTASQLGVLEELKTEMAELVPGLYKASASVVNMPPKAYRWVEEMKEIGRTHGAHGGFEFEGRDGKPGVFDAIAEIYRVIADDTVLGGEKTERRKRGRTVEDVALTVGEGLAAKKKKSD
ncbi:hypothetical protein QTJ16_002893 [Diplocarpon rosae]|uniref:6-phosphogluconate dehydrogenase C-terminal domain-like protein n=1 Tax=Diplocarpon rosae TaxID=946125 RepID=A0AAD9WE20_9HELO|nr:hypothetical protein QTJ16_002893 [Diplocarpon rosae]